MHVAPIPALLLFCPFLFFLLSKHQSSPFFTLFSFPLLFFSSLLPLVFMRLAKSFCCYWLSLACSCVLSAFRDGHTQQSLKIIWNRPGPAMINLLERVVLRCCCVSFRSGSFGGGGCCCWPYLFIFLFLFPDGSVSLPGGLDQWGPRGIKNLGYCVGLKALMELINLPFYKYSTNIFSFFFFLLILSFTLSVVWLACRFSLLLCFRNSLENRSMNSLPAMLPFSKWRNSVPV